MKKPGMTIAEHKEYGRILTAIRDELTRLSVVYGGKYPLPISRPLKKAKDIIDQFRSDMENLAYQEHSDATTKVYYPLTEDRGAHIGAPR